MRGPKLSREERKTEKVERRADMTERRERMMAGEEAYLLPRDKGPVRRYVRDVVDARRNVLGLFMPAALALIFVMLAVPAPAGPAGRLLAMLGLVLVMVIDGLHRRPQGQPARRREVPGQHREPAGSSASTRPAAPPSCAGCGRPGRRSPAAPTSPDLHAVRILVLGGIRSGKSRWAEHAVAAAAGDAPVRYVATGARPTGPDDAGWAHRVAAHRARRPAHWSTVETDDVAAALRTDASTATLVDDIGGWLTAAMDRRDAWSGGAVGGDVDRPAGRRRGGRPRRWCWSVRRSD